MGEQIGTTESPIVSRWLWHERTAWLLMLHAAAFGIGLASLHPDAMAAPSLMSYALVCAAIMACVCDSVLARKPMPYSWRLPMAILSPLLPITAAIVCWRSRRWWGLLWVAINLFVLLVICVLGIVCAAVMELVR